jgi:hypothetical protein
LWRFDVGEPVDLDALEALAGKATPGPWSAADEHGLMTGCTPSWVVSREGQGGEYLGDVLEAPQGSTGEQANAEFAAAAREAVPWLVGEVRRLREVERQAGFLARQLAEAVEGAGSAVRAAVADYRQVFPEPNSLPPNLALAVTLGAEVERLRAEAERAAADALVVDTQLMEFRRIGWAVQIMVAGDTDGGYAGIYDREFVQRQEAGAPSWKRAVEVFVRDPPCPRRDR